jgi:hypothetical protein
MHSATLMLQETPVSSTADLLQQSWKGQFLTVQGKWGKSHSSTAKALDIQAKDGKACTCLPRFLWV